MTKKTKKYLLDTSVLLHNPESMFHFEENEVIIPREVILELNKKKKDDGLTGKNARSVVRNLDILFAHLDPTEPFQDRSTISVDTEAGGKISLYMDLDFFYPVFAYQTEIKKMETAYSAAQHINHGAKNTTDLRLINISRNLDTILVTKDKTLRLLAKQLGVNAENYSSDIAIESAYKGCCTLNTTSQTIDKIYADGSVSPKMIDCEGVCLNEFVELRSENNTVLTRNLGFTVRQVNSKRVVQGIKPLNREQVFALDLLFDDEIDLITLEGPSGTGKTLLSLAAGMTLVNDMKKYQKLIISRPTVSVGDELGYLPGSLEEKLSPWMKPIYDNMDFLTDGQGQETVNGLKDYGTLEVEPIQYIRGRSMPGMFFVIDEAQNLSPQQIKTMISRAGEGTKIILTGDTDQIDQPYLSHNSNAITHVKDRFKGQKNYGHITLTKSERSTLAEQASTLL